WGTVSLCFFQAEDGIRDFHVTGVQTCALPISKAAVDYWRDVDLYIGGSEHATGHLLYSRFWNKFLKDIGHVPEEEPFKKLINQEIGRASGRESGRAPDGAVEDNGPTLCSTGQW